ncbi:GAF domain-containing protein [Corynebacterium sp. CCM 9185]|uniref:GAF domain-containing protein n=1 Tax=Corynebacterium marambiense TaxID=2765364 RepID=A0ABS0VWD3_9CORY|nr:GAF domain-containing protein [Corynebacterium marambiense]MBI8999652.1 GAF domain-containing protein [Corynebacterium marambiense]MCK7662490.1 GAF domain-containing protein [Corynebacterium marambiense]MCX7541779.1 GAF domain-containing protein [Corynebacterium marambiense]
MGGEKKTPEERISRFLTDAPEWLTTACVTIGSSATFYAFGKGGLAWMVISGALSLIVGLGLIGLRSKQQKAEDRSRSDWEEALREEMQSEVAKQIEQDDKAFRWAMNELSGAILKTADGMSDMSEEPLRLQMESVRKIILNMIRQDLGPTDGVRACLFTVNRDQSSLSAWQEDGRTRGKLSDRVFRRGDKTFEDSLKGINRFERDTLNTRVHEEYGSGYQTFATWPLLISGTLYGILTIDAPAAGDITDHDVDMFRTFAAVMSLTFAVEKSAPGIRADTDGAA